MTTKGSEDVKTSLGHGYCDHSSGSTTAQYQPDSLRLTTSLCRRHDYPIDRHRVALLVIDIQDYLSTPSTDETKIDTMKKYLFEHSLPSAIRNIEILLHNFRHIRQLQGKAASKEYGKPEIIFTYLEALTEDCRDISTDYKLSGPTLSTLPTPSKPATFLTNISPQGDEIRIPKTSCSVFLSTNIHYALRNLNVEQLVICGQITNQCVESACRDAADLGYFVTVAHDACTAYSLQDHEHSLSNMNGFARIIGTDQVVQELSTPTGSVMYQRSRLLTPMKTISTIESSVANDRDLPVQPISDVSPTPVTTFSNPNYCVENVAPRDSAIRLPIHSFLLALRAAQVQFLRYAAIDCTNGVRCKAVPLKRLLSDPDALNFQVCMAEVCFAGMSGFSDGLLKESGLTSMNVLVLRPDLESLRILPYSPSSALTMCTLHDQIAGRPSPLCTRTLLQGVIDKALDSMGLAFTVGAELEFVLFRLPHDHNSTSLPEPVDYSVFANMITLDEQESFVVTLCKWLDTLEIEITQVHAESAPGQFEVVLAHQDNALRLADHVVLAKETICACAKSHGLRSIFLPKVFPDQAGNGLHLHISIRREEQNNYDKVVSENIFVDRARPYGISQLGESFMEGILDHLPALISLTIPSTNSFRRIGQGCWTGSSITWSLEDKEVPVRVCIDSKLGYPTNVEYKLCDACCNIYLALACILNCGVDGISRKLTLRPAASMMSGNDSKSGDSANGAEMLETILVPDFGSALSCLRKDNFLLDLLGEKLSMGYFAVKEAEIKHSKGWNLEDELISAMKRA